MEAKKLETICKQLYHQQNAITQKASDDLSNREIFQQHAEILCRCGKLRATRENRAFEIDDRNRAVIQQLLYYFNGCSEFEKDGRYKLCNNIMLCGPVGVGKTFLMQVFSDYLRITNNKMQFYNLSVTQMINYYQLHNHVDKYTYNEQDSRNFEGSPFNICLNDVGMQTHLHFGTDTKMIVVDYFHARNEIWCQQKKFAHITTNLTAKEMKEYFKDDFGRLTDRFKTYNVISLAGSSRRG